MYMLCSALMERPGGPLCTETHWQPTSANFCQKRQNQWYFQNVVTCWRAGNTIDLVYFALNVLQWISRGSLGAPALIDYRENTAGLEWIIRSELTLWKGCEKFANEGHSLHCEWPSVATFSQHFQCYNPLYAGHICNDFGFLVRSGLYRNVGSITCGCLRESVLLLSGSWPSVKESDTIWPTGGSPGCRK